MKQRILGFFTKYSALTHMLLLLWNVFISTWSTGVSVSLGGVNVNARLFVAWLQHETHTPTWVPLLLTLSLNAYLVYTNLKTPQAKVMEARKTLAKLSATERPSQAH